MYLHSQQNRQQTVFVLYSVEPSYHYFGNKWPIEESTVRIISGQLPHIKLSINIYHTQFTIEVRIVLITEHFTVAVSAELTCSVSFLCSRFTQLCSFTPTQFHGTAGQIKYIDKTNMVQFNEGHISRWTWIM